MNKTMNKRIWPRPVVIPLPDETMGSGDVSINLLEEDWSMKGRLNKLKQELIWR